MLCLSAVRELVTEDSHTAWLKAILSILLLESGGDKDPPKKQNKTQQKPKPENENRSSKKLFATAHEYMHWQKQNHMQTQKKAQVQETF